MAADAATTTAPIRNLDPEEKDTQVGSSSLVTDIAAGQQKIFADTPLEK